MATRKKAASRRADAGADATSDADNAASTENDTDTPKNSRAAKKAAAATPGDIAAPRDEGFVRATALEFEKNRKAGKKGDNKTPAPRPSSFDSIIPYRDKDGNVIESPLASVVPIDRLSRKIKGFRIEKVVATRMGYYMHKRIREGEVFFIGLVGDGYLPSWVKVAESEDEDPKVARSRQVSQASSAQELLDDIEEDAGTEPPMALGGLQRRAHSSSGDVL